MEGLPSNQAECGKEMKGTHIPWKNQLKMGLSMSRVVSQMEMFLAYDKRVAGLRQHDRRSSGGCLENHQEVTSPEGFECYDFVERTEPL
jgi:hypothetical protein